jgi:hypothetical protein
LRRASSTPTFGQFFFASAGQFAGFKQALTEIVGSGYPVKLAAQAGEHLPADQHSPDLVGPGTDVIQLCVAQEPTSGVLVGVPVAAEALDRLVRNLDR